MIFLICYRIDNHLLVHMGRTSGKQVSKTVLEVLASCQANSHSGHKRELLLKNEKFNIGSTVFKSVH